MWGLYFSLDYKSNKSFAFELLALQRLNQSIVRGKKALGCMKISRIKHLWFFKLQWIRSHLVLFFHYTNYLQGFCKKAIFHSQPPPIPYPLHLAYHSKLLVWATRSSMTPALIHLTLQVPSISGLKSLWPLIRSS